MLEEILVKLNVNGSTIVKNAWGHLPAYTYADVIERILLNEGNTPIIEVFSEMSKPTSRALLKKVFNVSSLAGGHNWYLYTISLIGKRKCTACNAIKSVTEYYKDVRSYDGCKSMCITCDQKYKATHRSANLEQYAATASKYRAKKLKALAGWANLEEIKNIYTNCPSGYEVDHIIPIQGVLACGLHCEHNLQYLPMSTNRSKSNKFIIEDYSHNVKYVSPY